ncbi:MAG TPA: glycosyltransferase [Parvularculaceae bacterium]|nr:glycosyltransferase [Amphiplicatus sp.]MCB9954371.1 glycosyltransferase [Caulobacterales bacterium]HOP19152.1 glycosyltransferase [Amphiplicatus sp.]HPE30336.1 glycosyltransferase [Parvularculaceae bacterium]HRX39668.1 glycosyltransferase [Parvularculaceae bacterium]
MRILFLHDNFPAQFGFIGQFLAKNGWDVTFGTQRENSSMSGIKVFNYKPHREVTENIHPYAANYEKAVLAGQAVARAAIDLKKRGYAPDIVMAHSGWGPGLYAKELWPKAKYVGYFEWYYLIDAPDTAYVAPGQRELDELLRGRSRNAAILTDLAHCDAGICPTQFQKDQFPECFHGKLNVMHDGIDTDYFAPVEDAKLQLPDLDLSDAEEIITYVARGMEPYRGFPEFMAALEIVLKERPQAHAVIVGQDRVAYGKKLPEGDSFRKRALNEHKFDLDRLHFTGLLPRGQYRDVLLASSVHVYVTIPFVLSWSMLEAMSAGCAIIGSNVAPMQEIAEKAPDALRLVDMKDRRALANAIIATLDDKAAAKRMREAARDLMVSEYSIRKLYPAKMEWLKSL